eukprot:1903736-Alexandrium_andersonii.AAC.1
MAAICHATGYRRGPSRRGRAPSRRCVLGLMLLQPWTAQAQSSHAGELPPSLGRERGSTRPCNSPVGPLWQYHPRETPYSLEPR